MEIVKKKKKMSYRNELVNWGRQCQNWYLRTFSHWPHRSRTFWSNYPFWSDFLNRSISVLKVLTLACIESLITDRQMIHPFSPFHHNASKNKEVSTYLKKLNIPHVKAHMSMDLKVPSGDPVSNGVKTRKNSK